MYSSLPRARRFVTSFTVRLVPYINQAFQFVHVKIDSSIQNVKPHDIYRRRAIPFLPLPPSPDILENKKVCYKKTDRWL